MARLARVVAPGAAHHVTQRGNRRERVFFEDGDYALYRRLIAAAAKQACAEVWAYCFMPNHVHLIVTPGDEDGRPVESPQWLSSIESQARPSPSTRKTRPQADPIL